MTKEISLSLLLKVLKSAWWKILIIAVVVAVAVAAFTEFVVPKKYQSSIEFYVLNTSTTSEYTTTSLLASSEYLINDYIKIINSDQVIDIIVEKLKTEDNYDITPGQVRGMLASRTTDTSSTFTIIVTSGNAALSYRVASIIESEAPGVMRAITRPSYTSNYYKKVIGKDAEGNNVERYEQITETDLECVVPIRSPLESKTHSSPNVFALTSLGALVSAFIAYVIFLISKMSDTTIRSESNIRELLADSSVTIIGTIPYWGAQTETKKSTEATK